MLLLAIHCVLIVFAEALEVDTKFQPVGTQQVTSTFAKETKRILSDHVINFSVQCPSALKPNNLNVRFEEIYWINENNEFFKPDSSVLVSSANLIDKAQLILRVNKDLNYASCGYLYNNNYVRIKQWNFLYVGNYIACLVKNIKF